MVLGGASVPEPREVQLISMRTGSRGRSPHRSSLPRPFRLAHQPVSISLKNVVLNIVLGALAFLSLFLLLWQWLVAVRFPLHRRVADLSFCPPITLLKPLKGSDETTEASLRTWFRQEYAGAVQILFGVASAGDP